VFSLSRAWSSTGVSRRMIATNRSARDGRRLVHAIRRLAPALALAALCLASGAKADSLSAGKRAFSRQDYVRAAPLLLVATERGSPVARAASNEACAPRKAGRGSRARRNTRPA
jgi:hypothetical protein